MFRAMPCSRHTALPSTRASNTFSFSNSKAFLIIRTQCYHPSRAKTPSIPVTYTYPILFHPDHFILTALPAPNYLLPSPIVASSLNTSAVSKSHYAISTPRILSRPTDPSIRMLHLRGKKVLLLRLRCG